MTIRYGRAPFVLPVRLVDDRKDTVVRAALGVENDAGYLVSPPANVAKLRAVVDRAIALDFTSSSTGTTTTLKTT